MAYNALVNAEGALSSDAAASIQASYEEGVTDEFIKPIILEGANGEAVAKIEDGDAVVFLISEQIAEDN